VLLDSLRYAHCRASTGVLPCNPTQNVKTFSMVIIERSITGTEKT